MREGWTYKRLGEICTTITDGSHNPPKGIEYSNYRMISSQNIFDGELKIYDDNVRFLTEEDHNKEDKRTRLSKGVVLLTIVGTIGRSCVLNGNEGYLTLQRSVAALHPSSDIQSRFLMYCLIGNRNKLEKEAHGIAQRGIYLKQLSTLVIPIPPNNVQQSIVAELDKINELIGLKKSQLSDLDCLVQSIFYEMFGDPVENEKGWEVKKLGDLALVKTGPFGSMLHKEDYISNGIPLVNPIHMKDYQVKADMDFTVTEEKAKELSNYLMKWNDVVFARRGDIGRCAVVSEKEDGYLCGTGSLFVRFIEKIEPKYIMYIIRADSFTNELISKAKGATMLNLNSNTIASLLIPLPPLPLQQSFAARITAIEQQKQRISASIKDLETLLASRMQYWFDG